MTTNNNLEIRVYIANLGKYNEGELVGEWITLPADEDDLNALYARIKLGHFNEDGDFVHGYTEMQQFGAGSFPVHYEEMAIHDYEAPFQIGEYESLEKLNDWAERLNGVNEVEEIINAVFEYYSGVEEAIECLENQNYRTWDDCKDMSDVACYVVEEAGYLNDVPETVARYFDYEAFGRDLEIEGNFIQVNYNTMLEIIN